MVRGSVQRILLLVGVLSPEGTLLGGSAARVDGILKTRFGLLLSSNQDPCAADRYRTGMMQGPPCPSFVCARAPGTPEDPRYFIILKPSQKPKMAPTNAAGTPKIPHRLLFGQNQVQDEYATR
jgi:hypothetical protein